MGEWAYTPWFYGSGGPVLREILHLRGGLTIGLAMWRMRQLFRRQAFRKWPHE